MKTNTGSFPIGFRRRRSPWEQDLGHVLAWAAANDLEVVDVGGDGDVAGPQVIAAGLRLGSVDLPRWKGMISADPATRQQAVAENAAYVRACAPMGQVNHFLVMLPENPELPRAENFGYLVESYSQLVPVLESCGARLVIEGFPGRGSLICTPEGFKALFQAIPSPVMGVNYDPSHLVRMGIGPMRFLRDFVSRVYHVHGKDTELIPENLYRFGNELPALFAEPIPYGRHHWRYTIPGQGQIRWRHAFGILARAGYSGAVTIELEDASFMGSDEREQFGILQGAQFLAGC